MAASSFSSRRLADLLVEPRETLDVELKSWLDITGNNEHKALLAKAIIALANHGGGFVLIGFMKTDTGSGPDPARPLSMADFTPDAVNAIVARYCEPPFHCDVTIEVGPHGLVYPIISVPGDQTIPIRAKRDGPDGQTIKNNSYYIRRAGPKSEVPQTGQEWDGLIRRCVNAARTDMLDQIRAIISGGGVREAEPALAVGLDRWLDASFARWNELIGPLPAHSDARMPRGHFAIGYKLSGDIRAPSLSDLREALRQATVRHTGWPEFLLPTRPGIEPYAHEGMIECWLARDNEPSARDAAHSDFWRVSPSGEAFLIRGFQEDGEAYGYAPGTVFDITTPTWRVGEALLHAANLAALLGDPGAEVALTAEWSGLKGRRLAAHPSSNRLMFDNHISLQNGFRSTVSAVADEVGDTLPELVVRMVKPLYELFDFFRVPDALVPEELAKMRSNRLA